MPDIKTALSTALTEWEQDDKQQEKQMQKAPYVPHFKVTNNVTRATFDFVKNNPHQSCKTICAALEKDGYKPSSIGSLLTSSLSPECTCSPWSQSLRVQARTRTSTLCQASLGGRRLRLSVV